MVFRPIEKEKNYVMNWIRTSLILVVISIIYLSLKTPSEGIQIRWNDKLGHLFAYTVLTVNCGLLIKKSNWLYAAVAAFTLSAILEYAQGFVPGRTVEWADLLANALGVLLGWTILKVLHPKIVALLQQLRLMRKD